MVPWKITWHPDHTRPYQPIHRYVGTTARRIGDNTRAGVPSKYSICLLPTENLPSRFSSSYFYNLIPFYTSKLIPVFSCVLIEFLESGVLHFRSCLLQNTRCLPLDFFLLLSGRKKSRPDNFPSYVSLLSSKVLFLTLSLQVSCLFGSLVLYLRRIPR